MKLKDRLILFGLFAVIGFTARGIAIVAKKTNNNVTTSKFEYIEQDYEMRRMIKICEANGVKVQVKEKVDNELQRVVFPKGSYTFEIDTKPGADFNQVLLDYNLDGSVSSTSSSSRYKAIYCGMKDIADLKKESIPLSEYSGQIVKSEIETDPFGSGKEYYYYDFKDLKNHQAVVAWIGDMDPVILWKVRGRSGVPVTAEIKDIRIAILDTSK